jgi:Transposase domain (DUF772)
VSVRPGPMLWCRSSRLGQRGPATPAERLGCGYVITSTGSGTTQTSSLGIRATAAPDSLLRNSPRSVCCTAQPLRPAGGRAAEAVRCRIDFKYALALELDDPGFHHGVLTDFRERLCEDDRADQLLSLSLERMRDAGMVAERGKQRTDSTRVLAAARDPTRLELVLEALRAAPEGATQRAPDVLVDADRATRCGRPVRLPSRPAHPATRLRQAGADARRRPPVAGRGRSADRSSGLSRRTGRRAPSCP